MKPTDTTPALSRRKLLKGGIATLFCGSAPMILSSRVLGRAGQTGPNSLIRIGVIGNGLISEGHRGYALTSGQTSLAALCDVNRQVLENLSGQIKANGGSCDTYTDHRELCARTDIDAVFVTTPDHWHAAISIDAMRNGKDVYVEKPMTLTIEEGKAMCAAAARYGRIVQVGSQQRSNDSFRKASELVLNGYIGKVHTVVTQLGEFPPPTQFPAEPVPAHLDYDRWLGPAPWEPYHAERVVGNYGGGWRRFWEYGSRKNGDWGAHHFDIIQWALGMDESGPTLFVPKGVDGEHQYHVYADGTKVIRDGDSKGAMIRFIGEKGEVHVGRDDAFVTTPAELKSMALKSSDKRLYVSSDHRRDWLQAIRTRSQPICHVGIGHRTATICQLSGIAEILGRALKWDPATELVVDDAVATRMMDRPRRAPYALPF
jgi:predicted dehydrogenase